MSLLEVGVAVGCLVSVSKVAALLCDSSGAKGIVILLCVVVLITALQIQSLGSDNSERYVCMSRKSVFG